MNELENDILYNILEHQISDKSIHNIRKNGKSISYYANENVKFDFLEENKGMKINIQDNTQNQTIQIPVIITEDAFTDKVINEFNIGTNCDITILAGCAIHNGCEKKSLHSGLHIFNVGKNSKITYIEKHYGCGKLEAEKEINTDTIINLDEDSYLLFESTQISGVSKSKRITKVTQKNNTTFEAKEKLLTTDNEIIKTEFHINLDGLNSKSRIDSRSILKDNSQQEFYSEVIGNTQCFAHINCDAITLDNAKVVSTPKIISNHKDALLTHEASIGKINDEQIVKLQTLGLTKEEAENEIIKGFVN